jgi:asparagine synthase (glutamine-hydrolysing)
MCGITGFNWQDEPLVRRMCDTIAHRGPDDSGVYTDAWVSLGHRRLSIIDLNHGRQPLANEDETVWIVFNGEIYNFPELRKQLLAAGHRFKTATDTEVIVHLYEQHDTDCVRHLRGMFAFAIWDQPKRRLFLARDHIGQKPLFFYYADSVFAFASEIKALLRLSRVKVEMDAVAMNHMISLRYAPGTGTLFKGIHKLPAAHWMLLEDGKLRTERYWQLDYTKKLAGKEDEIVGDLKKLLLETVKSHLISDVPVGAFLSGGIDSSTVTAMMAAHSSGGIQSFSIGVREADFNELPYARLVANRYKTDHHERIAEDQLVRLLPKLIWHMDEITDPFGFGVFLVAQLASSHVKVVLGGDGGDEIFAGYDRYAGHKLVDYYCFLPAALRKNVLGTLIRCLPDSYSYNNNTQKLRWLNEMSLTTGGDRYAQSLTHLRFPREVKERLYTAALRQELSDDYDSTRHVLEHFETDQASDTIDKMLYTDMMTRMPEHLLRIVDHMTMAHGLEDRSPLLDHRLVEFAASIPVNLKLRGRKLKYVFKQVARDFLPPELLSRSKQGFSFPLAYWMKARLGNLLEGLFSSSRLAEEGYFRRGYMLELLNQHRSGKADHNYRLWILLNLELWWRLYIDRVNIDTLGDLVNQQISFPKAG